MSGSATVPEGNDAASCGETPEISWCGWLPSSFIAQIALFTLHTICPALAGDARASTQSEHTPTIAHTRAILTDRPRRSALARNARTIRRAYRLAGGRGGARRQEIRERRRCPGSHRGSGLWALRDPADCR